MSPFDEYLGKYVADTESPLLYHRWCLIGGVAAMLGRNTWVPFGHNNIYPNQFIMLIGSPGVRKSTAITLVKKLVLAAGFDTIAANRTSKEKFLLDLYGMDEDGNAENGDISTINIFGGNDSDDRPRELLIAADEFTNFAGLGNYEFISLLGELWDCPSEYIVRTKTSHSYKIPEPTISLLGGNTPSGFAAAFPPDMMGQGFFSRMILVNGTSTGKRITIPRAPDVAETEKIVAYLQTIREKVRGAMTFEDEAFEALDYLYQNWVDLEDIRFQHYSSRRLTHLIKLITVCTAMRISTRISREDVILANSILTLTESEMPAAMGEFGKSRHSDVSARVLAILEDSPPLTLREIWKHGLSNDLEKMSQLSEIIQNLAHAEKIQQLGGKFLPKKKAVSGAGKYVNLSLLQEWKERQGEIK